MCVRVWLYAIKVIHYLVSNGTARPGGTKITCMSMAVHTELASCMICRDNSVPPLVIP